MEKERKEVSIIEGWELEGKVIAIQSLVKVEGDLIVKGPTEHNDFMAGGDITFEENNLSKSITAEGSVIIKGKNHSEGITAGSDVIIEGDNLSSIIKAGGRVIIKGDNSADRIIAESDVEIEGYNHYASIESGGNVTIKEFNFASSITAKENVTLSNGEMHQIEAGGNIEIKGDVCHAEGHTTIKAGGNINIGKVSDWGYPITMEAEGIIHIKGDCKAGRLKAKKVMIDGFCSPKVIINEIS